MDLFHSVRFLRLYFIHLFILFLTVIIDSTSSPEGHGIRLSPHAPDNPVSRIDSQIHPILFLPGLPKDSLIQMTVTDRRRVVESIRKAAPACAVHQMIVDDEGRVQVYLFINDWTESERSDLVGLGARIEIEKPEIGVIQCSIPANRLEQAASLGWVQYIGKPNYGIVNSRRIQDATETIQNEGDRWLRLDSYRTQSGFSGSGYTVGVISDGIFRIEESQAAGELPSEVTARSFRWDGRLYFGGEGTAILEQVHDNLPGASLYFANAGTELEFIEAINWLADNCDAIVCDIAYFGIGPLDGGGYFDRCMSEAARKVISFSSSVGNQGDAHYSGTYWDPDGNGLHNFSETREYMNVWVNPDGIFWASLYWDDHFQLGRKNNYRLIIRDIQGELLAESTPLSTIAGQTQYSGYPSELAYYVNDSSSTLFTRVYIQGAGSEERELHFNLMVNPGGRLRDQIVPPGSLHNVSVAHGVTSAGAYDCRTACTISGDLPGQSPIGGYAYSLETFSSYGPSWDGRILPSLLAPDRIRTFSDFWNWKEEAAKTGESYPGDTNNFSGTSASAATIGSTEVITYQDGSMAIMIGGVPVVIDASVLEETNNTVIQAVGSSGMQFLTSAGNGSPDILLSQALIASIGAEEFDLMGIPDSLELIAAPGTREEVTLILENPHQTVPAIGRIRFDPRSLIVWPAWFNIPPGESLEITVRSRADLPAGRYLSTFNVGHMGGDPEGIAVPVEVRVETTPVGNTVIVQEEEPNNPMNASEVFTLSQLVTLPIPTGEHPGDSQLRITGTISTVETGHRGYPGSDDAEDWFRFTLAKEETLTISVTPFSATADLDLFLVQPGGATRAMVDRERDGWPERIGPLTLPAGTYAVGVGAYDRNFPNSDGTYTDYEAGYELDIRIKAPPLYILRTPLTARADNVCVSGNHAVLWGIQGIQRALYALNGNSWELTDEITGDYRRAPVALFPGSNRFGVVWDANPTTNPIRMQYLQLWNYSETSGLVLDATWTPIEEATNREIKSLGFSQSGQTALLALKSYAPSVRYDLVSMNVQSGEEIGRYNLGKDGTMRFETLGNSAFGCYRTYTPEGLHFYDLSDGENITPIGSVTPSSSISGTLFTIHRSGRRGYYVTAAAGSVLISNPLPEGEPTTHDLEQVIQYLSWNQQGNRLYITCARSLFVGVTDSIGNLISIQEIPYPNIGTGTRYSPGPFVYLQSGIGAMKIDSMVIWFVDVENLEGIEFLRTNPTTLMELGTTVSGDRLHVAGTDALSIRIDLDNLLGEEKSINPLDLPRFVLDPPMVGFANIECGTESHTEYIRVRNIGRVDGHIHRTEWTPGLLACGEVLASTRKIEPGQYWQISVKARPAEPGLQQGIVRVYTDDPVEPVLTLLASVSGVPGTLFACGDTNGDGKIDFRDVAGWTEYWMKEYSQVPQKDRFLFNLCDANFDGKFDMRDILTSLTERNRETGRSE